MRRRGLALWFWLCVPTLSGPVPGCLSALDVESAPSGLAVPHVGGSGDRLIELERLANAEPQNTARQQRAGLAFARATLRGDLRYREDAERFLERAFRLGGSEHATRALGRFLNMRSSVLDLERLDLQIEVYESLFDQRARAPQNMSEDQFTIHCFLLSARALDAVKKQKTLAALRWVRRLESDLAQRTSVHPDEIDTFAMAGNYELTFAGVMPVGRARRLRRAIEYLEVQQARWDELSPGARNRAVAPNTRTVFTFQLAEALLAVGDVDRARHYYHRVIALEGDAGASVPRRDIVALSRERLADPELLVGQDALLPAWPAGVTGCVACHSRTARLPQTRVLRADPSVLAKGAVPGGL